MDIAARIISILERHPKIRSVRLAGSRLRGDATDLSDWDFEIETTDFDAVARDLPELVRPLKPLAAQWDRLGPFQAFMLILPGAVKMDLMFPGRPRELEPPWKVSAETINGIDEHFWDWIVWLVPKQAAGKTAFVREELTKMRDHLLAPMGVAETPRSVEEAIDLYLSARDTHERRLGVRVRRDLQEDGLRFVTRASSK